VRRGHVPPPLRIRHGRRLYRERESGEELYQRERGVTIGGGPAPPPVAPCRRRVIIGHAADASEPREWVALVGRAGGGGRGAGSEFLPLGRAGPNLREGEWGEQAA
jgi:hypothetical protein